LGAKHLSDALSINSTLISLFASSCGLGDIGVAHLGDGLILNCDLCELDISNNDFGSEGISDFCSKLGSNINSKLQTLRLSRTNIKLNHIGTRGAESIAELLSKNTCITSLE
jgi:hypothetical protein